MDVVVTITEYKRRLKAMGYAENTIKLYRMGLKQFSQYLAAHNIKELRKVTKQTILAYQGEIVAESTAIETKAIKLRAVKRLFEYLTDTHQLLVNPTEGIVETCRKHRKIGITLTVKEIKNLLAQPNLSFRAQIRDRAIMGLLYSTGIRVNELLNLTVHDLDFKDKTLYVRKGKGRKQRVIPLGKNAILYVKEYLEKIRPRWSKRNAKERALFLTNGGKTLQSHSVQQALNSYRELAGIKKPVSPHTFRRTCATHLLQQGADIRYIQKLLGHRHLKTTQSYTKVMPVEVKKTHEKSHPGVPEDENNQSNYRIPAGP